MKLTALLLAIVIFISALAGAVFAAGAPAERVNISVTDENGAPLYNLTDGSNYSYQFFPGGHSITVSAYREFSYLYIRWHGPVNPWELRAGERSVTGGENGFMHELVQLPEPAKSAVIYVPGDILFGIADIYAYTASTLPEEVQRWEPPCDKADILLFPTHSDDEFVFFGGIIPYYAGELGLNVQVCYMTDHYIGLDFSHRCHELLDSLWEAGELRYPVINPVMDESFADTEKAAAVNESFTAFQVEQIRRFKPSVIVGHDLLGEYGHLYHMYNAECLTKALELAADPAAYPAAAEKYGTWDTPKTYLHLYGPESERTSPDFSQPLQRFGGRSAYKAALDAFAMCYSQIREGSYTVYPVGHVYDSSSFGLYRSTVGEDVMKTDLMENIAN